MVYPKFNLRDLKSNGEVPINMMLNYEGYRLKLSTGIKILPKYWNESKQRVRTTAPHIDRISHNEKLDFWELKLKESYKYFSDQGKIPTPAILKKKFLKELKPKAERVDKKQKVMSFWEAYELFIEEKRRMNVTNDVIKDYNNSLRKHLLNFAKKEKIKIDFDTFKNDQMCYAEKFDQYLLKEVKIREGVIGLAPNSAGKVVKNLKAVLHFCFAKGITSPFSVSHMVTRTELVDAVYMTLDEIEKLYKHKFEDKVLEATRDLFVVGCDTGLRFSDYKRIIKDHVSGGMIRLKQQKTKRGVTIPMSTRVKEVLEKYEYNIPCPKSVSEFNKLLRLAAKEAKINQMCPVSSSRMRYEDKEYLPKFELLTSHTARRSFCTNMYIKKVRVELIMKISGHKTQQAFMRYLKLDNETAAKEMMSFID